MRGVTGLPSKSLNHAPSRFGVCALLERIVNFLKREEGPTAVEYAVMLALIIVVCIGAITTLGTAASNTFQNIDNNLPASAS